MEAGGTRFGKSDGGGRRGDRTRFAPAHLRGPPYLLADPEVGADRQLVLAAQGGRVDDRGAADRFGLLGDPDAERGAGAVGAGDGD
jgi:hypothetical protein